MPARGNELTFKVLAGVLRLATKYLAQDLRRRLIDLLSVAYPTTYKGCMGAGESMWGNEDVHPNRVLMLFQECAVPELLPFAFLQVSRRGMESIFDTGKGVQLSHDTLRIASVGLTRLQQDIHEATRLAYSPSPLCKTPSGRNAALVDGTYRMRDVLEENIDLWTFFDEINTSRCCMVCDEHMRAVADNFMVEVWDMLPDMFELEAYARDE